MTRMKDLSPELKAEVAKRLPNQSWEFLFGEPAPPASSSSLDARVEDAKRFIHGEPAQDDDLSWRHKAVQEGQLKDARRALGKTGDRTIGPPAKLEREQFTPRPGHEWLTRAEAAGILERDEGELNRYAIQAAIGLRTSDTGAIEYNAADLLAHARDRGLIHKNEVWKSLANSRES